MEDKKSRWGILAVAVMMFLVTLVVADINGTKNSIYMYVWIMVGYFAYKGDLARINKWMLALIWINVLVMFMVAIFMDDKSMSNIQRGWSSRVSMLVGVCIMLVPKIILYFYTNNLMNNFQKSANSSKDNVEMLMTKAKVEVKNMKTTSINAVDNNENKFWEMAVYELNNNTRNEAVWARLFSETDGDENKTKARYLKYRVDELKAEELKNESLAAEVTPTVKLQDEVVSSESRTNIALPLEVDAEKGSIDVVVTLFKVFMVFMFIVTLLILIFA